MTGKTMRPGQENIVHIFDSMGNISVFFGDNPSYWVGSLRPMVVEYEAQPIRVQKYLSELRGIWATNYVYCSNGFSSELANNWGRGEE